MSQSVVCIRLNGHPYKIGCGAGEEDHVAKLGSEVEVVMQSLISSVGQIGEARLLAMVSLILADRAAAPLTGNSLGAEPPLQYDLKRCRRRRSAGRCRDADGRACIKACI